MIIKVVNRSDNELPSYQTEHAAGLDLKANLDKAITLVPMQRALIPTGLFIEIPAGFEGQIRPRSGLAAKHGITVLNSPGTIDADYRGEVKVILINLSNEDFEIKHGERIAQLLISNYEMIDWEVTETLTESERSTGGFGSTGK
jgi:dUTP pyrophosphatase